MKSISDCKILLVDDSRENLMILTVLSDADDKVWGFSAGGVDYITKPFDATEIRARVKTHLRLSLYEQEQRFQIDYLSACPPRRSQKDRISCRKWGDSRPSARMQWI